MAIIVRSSKTHNLIKNTGIDGDCDDDQKESVLIIMMILVVAVVTLIMPTIINIHTTTTINQ